MSSSEEIIEPQEQQVPEKKSSGGIKAIAAFSYIGKILIILAALILLVGFVFFEEMTINKIENADQNTAQFILESKIFCLLYIFASIYALKGIRKMIKGQRKGFYIYVLSNIVTIALLAYNANMYEWIIAGSVAVFILLYLPFVRKLAK